ncbi:MAG: hypothetical protein WCF14_07595 [Nitrososphaeraceae archaeon]
MESRFTTFELMVSDKLIILRVIPSEKKSPLSILFGESKISDSIIALMSQTLGYGK